MNIGNCNISALNKVKLYYKKDKLCRYWSDKACKQCCMMQNLSHLKPDIVHRKCHFNGVTKPHINIIKPDIVYRKCNFNGANQTRSKHYHIIKNQICPDVSCGQPCETADSHARRSTCGIQNIGKVFLQCAFECVFGQFV